MAQCILRRASPSSCCLSKMSRRKSKVSDLLGDWAKSGFLIRGSEIIPWNQVQRIEATNVEELSRDESELRRKEWEARETARMQQSFWKTKKGREKKEEGDDKSEPRAAA